MLWQTVSTVLRVPYHEPGDGVWGAKTATLNFCEEDYVLSRYCAETCNTITNLVFLWLGIKGVRNCLKYSHSTVFLIAFLGYVAVGTGSALFHATLKYPMQLIDELSMIYTSCLMCFSVFSFRKRIKFQLCLGIFLIVLALFITVYYYVTQNPVFHQTTYGLLTITLLGRSIWAMENTLRPQLRTRENATERTKYSDTLLREMWQMVLYGMAAFLCGFIIWNLDNIFCSTIRRWRRAVGLPWGLLLEGHGWWHLLTGLGAYFYIVWGIWLRRCLEHKEKEYVLTWPHTFTSVPEITLLYPPKQT